MTGPGLNNYNSCGINLLQTPRHTRHEDMSRCHVCHVSGGDSCDRVTDADLLRLHSHISRHEAGEERSREKRFPKSQILCFWFK